MKRTKILILLVLAVSLALLSLTGCNIYPPGNKDEADEIIASARSKLESLPYVAVTKTEFSTDDESLADLLNETSGAKITLVSFGESFTLSSSFSVSDITSECLYTSYGGTLYKKTTLTTSSGTVTELECANLGVQDKAMLLSRLGAGANIDEKDFETVSATVSKDGDCTLTASDVRSESLDGIKIAMQNKLNYAEGVEVTGAEYSLLVSDGALTESRLTIHLTLTGGTEVSSLTVTLNTSYSMRQSDAISAPENAQSYEQKELNDLLG